MEKLKEKLKEGGHTFPLFDTTSGQASHNSFFNPQGAIDVTKKKPPSSLATGPGMGVRDMATGRFPAEDEAGPIEGGA